MNKKLYKNKTRAVISLIAIYTMVFSFIVPTQMFGSNEHSSIQPQNPKVDEAFGETLVYFEENQGQFDKRVNYFAHGTSGYSLFLTGTEAVYVLSDTVQSSEFRVQS